MKKPIRAVGILLIFFLCTGCSMQPGNDISEGKATEKPEMTEEPGVKNGAETPEETERLAGYEESYDSEGYRLEGTYEIAGDISKEVPPDPYGDTNEDGSIDLFLKVTGGTPYAIAGAVFDREMFSMKAYGKVVVEADPDAAGGGSAALLLRFTPQCAGETEVIMLRYYFGHEVYEGLIYHITVGEDLKCRLDWYGFVSEEENLELHLEEPPFENDFE